MIPRATYRLQFHKDFPFGAAQAQTGYLAELGISHVYCSPILTARAGSMHGYDVIDPSRINPELGGEDGFRAMAAAFSARGIGIILDIVPNHMAVGKADNPWWLDLLANGPNSRYASTFDIDWDCPGLEGKVLAPFLAEAPPQALAKGDLKLVRENGKLAFAYFEHRFPLRLEDQALGAIEGLSQAELLGMLARQYFVLAEWREADRRINWRRFFDITDLAAIRAGESEVFESVHGKVLELYAAGLIDGVRVDHVDGIADPAAYCRRLRQRLESIRPGACLVVEKILADGEELPPDWLADGTTGYDFLEEVSALLHTDDNGYFETLWHKHGRRNLSFEEEESAARREILATKFAGQFAGTVRAFSKGLPASGIKELEAALTEIIVRLRCYRSYATGGPDTPGAGSLLKAAFARAQADIPEISRVVAVLAELFERNDGDGVVSDALRRFAQLTAPVAAKSVEDTAFYRYGRLLSRNDVGCDPRRHFFSIGEFHERMARRAQCYPRSMLTTATHDHKRGEDARMRLAALSEGRQAWQDLISSVGDLGSVHPGDAYCLCQTLFASWPQADADEAFLARISGWCEKYLREGKLRSSWTCPKTEYENALRELARKLILELEGRAFRERMARLLEDSAGKTRTNSLVQLVLRNTLPGVPDVYQGCEYADLSMVDPDNRRAVDFAARLSTLRDGSVEKQRCLTALLNARKSNPGLWDQGNYSPINIEGCVAFSRNHKAGSATVVAQLAGPPPDGILVLDGMNRELFTARRYSAGPIRLDGLFRTLPVAVFLGLTS